MTNPRVLFVCYDGSYPNLCRGKLVLSVDGVDYEFPPYCMNSGGGVSFDSDRCGHVSRGDWSVHEFPDGFPPECQIEAVRVINENVGRGCCGGCV